MEIKSPHITVDRQILPVKSRKRKTIPANSAGQITDTAFDRQILPVKCENEPAAATPPLPLTLSLPPTGGDVYIHSAAVDTYQREGGAGGGEQAPEMPLPEKTLKAAPAEKAAKTTPAGSPKTLIPADFSPAPDVLAAIAERFPCLDTDLATDDFRDYWAGRGADARAYKADWQATWRNYMRDCEDKGRYRKKRAGPNQTGAAGSVRRPGRMNMDEALVQTRENLAKIASGGGFWNQ